MIAIMKSNKRLTEDDAEMIKKSARGELADAGFGNDIPAIVLGKGMEMTLLSDSGAVIYSSRSKNKRDLKVVLHAQDVYRCIQTAPNFTVDNETALSEKAVLMRGEREL